MVRTQIQLELAQADALKRVAAERRISIAEAARNGRSATPGQQLQAEIHPLICRNELVLVLRNAAHERITVRLAAGSGLVTVKEEADRG